MRLNSASPNSEEEKAKKEWLKAPHFLHFFVTFQHGCAEEMPAPSQAPWHFLNPVLSILKFPGNPTLPQPYFSCLGINMWHSGGTEHHGRVSTEYLWEWFYWPVSSTRYWKTRCTTFKSWCFTLWGLLPELCCPQWKGKQTQRSGICELSSKLSSPPDVYYESLLPVACTNSIEPFPIDPAC